MPFYDYKCPGCGKKLELYRPVSDCRNATCPNCGARAERVYEGKWNFGRSGGASSCNGNCSGCAGCASGRQA